IRRTRDFVKPGRLSRVELHSVHTAEYLRSLKSPANLAGILELPIVRRLPGWLVEWRILAPMRRATAGTILACRLAMSRGLAINLGGGFHHAGGKSGGGFCVYADVPLAAKLLHDEGGAGNVLVIDLDAHHGNGTASVFRDWPWAFILDLYQRDLFPLVKVREDL